MIRAFAPRPGWTILFATLTLGACTNLAPEYRRPVAPVPPPWPTGEAYRVQSDATLPVVSYREIFQDPDLRTLIGQALANNRDVRIAAADVAAARAQVRVTRSGEFPEVGVNVSSDSRTRGESTTSLRTGVASFDLDLFGELANSTRAERELALASAASAHAVRLALVADLATAWATYGADRDLLAIAQDTANDAQRAVGLTRLRLEGGIAPRSDLTQAQQVLATAEGDVALQKAALAQDENLVRLLVGSSYDAALLPAGMDEVRGSVATMPAGTSSAVLLRRPDVVQAEYRLRAANADIGVARARLFPTVSLSGLLDLAGAGLGTLFSGPLGASAGAGVGYAIFDAGGRRAGVEVSEAQRNAALAAYERAIQTAFREVADALAIQGTIAERLRTAKANTQAAQETARLANARYREGIDDFLASLDARRSLYTARRAQVAVALAAVENRIELYRRLAADNALASPPAAEKAAPS